MDGKTEESGNMRFLQAEKDDYVFISKLCEAENWVTTPEYIEQLASDLPAANHVSKSGDILTGFCLGFPINETEGFVSMLIVHKDYRRRGIAKKLLLRTIESLGKRNITLYGSPSGVSLYKSVGFKCDEPPAYLYERTFQPVKHCLTEKLTDEKVLRIVTLNKVNFKDLIQYDTDVHKICREKWIKAIVSDLPDSVAVLDEKNKIVGYAGIRKCAQNDYTELCPMITDSQDNAIFLLKRILDGMPEGSRLKVKIPSENINAVQIMTSIGFPIHDPNPHLIMFTRYRFETDICKVYSVLNDVNQFA